MDYVQQLTLVRGILNNDLNLKVLEMKSKIQNRFIH